MRHDDHAAAAARTEALRSVIFFASGLLLIAVLLLRPWHGEQPAGQCDVGDAVAIGEKAEVSDAVEAPGQNVDQEAADELVRLKRHGPVALSKPELPAPKGGLEERRELCG